MSRDPNTASLAVIGAGAWGTVLAGLLGRNGHDVQLWSRREALAAAMSRTGTNPEYVPGWQLGDRVHATSDLTTALAGRDAIFLAVPSVGLRAVLALMADRGGISAVMSCAKGIEHGTFKRFSQVIGEYLPAARLAALSGPNLATEIAEGLPAAATIASSDERLATVGQQWLQQRQFRVYRSRDLAGVEIAGAMKNVVALAAGMCDGLALGDNAKASIITRGLAEIARLGTHLGGELRTFYGLAGVGDLVATCASQRSRNYTAGRLIATGTTLAQLRAEQLNAEGIPTVQAVVHYARDTELDLPIATEVHRVVYEGKNPQHAIVDLMTRELRSE